MRGVTIPKTGPASVLEVREYPDPQPAEGQVRIAVRAAGLNFAEVSARQGLYPDAPKLPTVMGYEVGGTIDAVGPGVPEARIGQRVVGLCRFGGHASSVVVPQRAAMVIPERMTFSEAAAIPVNYLTAHHMLFQIGTVHPKSSVLVHMAAGGVGTAALQLLKTVPGVISFGTASAAKHDYLRELGCTHPIDYHTQDYVEEILKLTNGRGVDIVLDALGGEHWKKSWSLVAPAGRMVAFGFANAIRGSTLNYFRVGLQAMKLLFVTPVGLMGENKSLQGVNLGHLWDQDDLMLGQLARLLQLYDEGVVRPHIDAEIPFDRAAEAHTLIEERKNKGKVVLIA